MLAVKLHDNFDVCRSVVDARLEPFQRAAGIADHVPSGGIVEQRALRHRRKVSSCQGRQCRRIRSRLGP